MDVCTFDSGEPKFTSVPINAVSSDPRSRSNKVDEVVSRFSDHHVEPRGRKAVQPQRIPTPFRSIQPSTIEGERRGRRESTLSVCCNDCPLGAHCVETFLHAAFDGKIHEGYRLGTLGFYPPLNFYSDSCRSPFPLEAWPTVFATPQRQSRPKAHLTHAVFPDTFQPRPA